MSDDKDFEIVDGRVVPVGADASRYQYGERYVRCVLCGLKRPASAMVAVTVRFGDEKRQAAVCGDGYPGCRPIGWPAQESNNGGLSAIFGAFKDIPDPPDGSNWTKK